MEFPDEGATVTSDDFGVRQVQQIPELYVVPPEPIPAWINDRHNGRHLGEVLAWRGTRCHVTYRSDKGRHLHWIDAKFVERVE